MANQKRIEQLKQLALEHRMEFQEEEKYSSFPYLAGFKLFTTGKHKKIYNILSWQDDFLETKIKVFDYQFKPYDKKESTQYQTVFFINSKALALPEFYMQPENFFHKLIAYLGFEDIDFKSHPEFSDQYYLKGKDEERVRASFSEPVLDYFTYNNGWYMEGVGYYMILYIRNHQMAVRDVFNVYTRGMRIFRLLKEKAE